MKYGFILPLSALFALTIIQLATHFSIIPTGLDSLQEINRHLGEYFYVLIFLIILLEAIVFIGFYFPGQFFAVVLVIGATPSVADIVYLTLAMVGAATLASIVNLGLGRRQMQEGSTPQKIRLKSLLLAMIHINSLAFFMVSQGAKGQRWRVVWLAGLLNLPYYLLLIAGTAILSDEIMQLAENTYFIFSALLIWLIIAIFMDIKNKHRN